MSRHRNQGRKGSAVAGSAEEARALEALILQAHQTGSDEAGRELTQRVLRCLERERLRPLHQVLGSLVEQRHWGAFGALLEWIQQLAGEMVVDRVDEQGARTPAMASLFLIPVLIRCPDSWPENGKTLDVPHHTGEALTRTFDDFGAVSSEASLVLIPALVPPEGLYGLGWTRVRGLLQEMVRADGDRRGLSDERRVEVPSDIVNARAEPERGVRLMIGFHFAPAEAEEYFFEASAAGSREAWGDAFGAHLDSWLGVADRAAEGAAAFLPRWFYDALGEGLSQAEDLAALDELARGLQGRYAPKQAAVEAHEADDGAAVLLRAHVEGREAPASEAVRRLWPHERAEQRMARIRDWLEREGGAAPGDPARPPG